MIASVTGTKGKTTVISIMHHCLFSSGRDVETLSTLGVFLNEKRKTRSTNFGTVEKFLKSESKIKCVELTSWVLARGLISSDFSDVVVVTGVERGEHTEIHKTFSDYIEAKKCDDFMFENRNFDDDKPELKCLNR